MHKYLILAMAVTTAAHAQPQQQPLSPSELAIQINNAVNGLATALENANRQLKQLSDQNAELQRQLDEIKAKGKTPRPPDDH